MIRPIDANALLEHVYRDKLDSRELIERMVKNAPTIEIDVEKRSHFYQRKAMRG